ncbi:MAG TPA: protein kinase [Acidimicrobiales bacterium]|jgi:serine/threonine-protein kinase|nr:protein kinase [Acidimicrobiales bacterium]
MAPTFSPDHLLAGRYRIVHLLGVGQTAEIYEADDVSLQRRVAVKVLLPGLAQHEDIRRAFRDRIIRASTLSHPHLARVFDGGQESGAIFMISEYLGGGSLEDVLRSGRHLSIDDGARLGRDVASALGYAHEHGFVLGNLSPSKLIFDDDGRVRVSDVALAGLASAYRERMTLDDARYLSPEQAVGEAAGPESDVYALALILFEAVTGSAAYEGSTPEAILRARLDAPLPVRLELGTLDMVLAQAAVPDPRLRLDAAQFSARLGAVVGDASPLIVHPGAEEPLLAQFEPLKPRSSIGFSAPSAEQVTGASPIVAAGSFPRAPRGQVSSSPTVRTPLGRTPRFERPSYDLPRTERRRWGFLVAAIVIVVLAIVAGALWKEGFFKSTNTVPNLVGKTTAQASSAITSDGYTLQIADAYSPTVAVNDIISQSPVAGAKEKSGTVIEVQVSKGPAVATLPKHLVGESCTTAATQLTAIHVKSTCPAGDRIYSNVTSANRIARVLYKGTANPLAVPRGATVILERSKGPHVATTTTTTPPAATTTTTTTTTAPANQGPRAVPNVVGDDYAQATAAMHKAVLYFTTEGPGAGTTTWTKVVSEDPIAGTKVAYKSTIILHVQ